MNYQNINNVCLCSQKACQSYEACSPRTMDTTTSQGDFTLMKRLIPVKDIYKVVPTNSFTTNSYVNQSYVGTVLMEVPEYYAVKSYQKMVDSEPQITPMPAPPTQILPSPMPSYREYGSFPLPQSTSSLNLFSQLSETKISQPTTLPENCNPILKGFKFEYKPCKNAIRNKRIIVCKYDNCNKEFTKSWNFLDHARMHEGLKPFVCDICGKSFTQSGNMKKHRKQHAVDDIDKRKIYK